MGRDTLGRFKPFTNDKERLPADYLAARRLALAELCKAVAADAEKAGERMKVQMQQGKPVVVGRVDVAAKHAERMAKWRSR